MPSFHFLDGPLVGQSFDLDNEAVTIGRAADNDIQIKDSSISRKHLTITQRGDQFFIRDLKSRNGTWINGYPLRPGDDYELEQGVPIIVGNILTIFGKRTPEDGMLLQYSIDLTDDRVKTRELLLYKDRRWTRRRDLELIYGLATILMQSFDIDVICEKVMDSVFQTLERMDFGALLLLDAGIGPLEAKTVRTRSNGAEATSNGYSRTIVERAVREQRAVMMSDTGLRNEEDLSDSIKLMRIKSVICVPLLSSLKVRGVIYAHSSQVPHGFQKEDLFLLTALSAPVALSIENAHLYAERKKTEELLRKSHDALEEEVKTRTTDLVEANELLRQEITERKGAENALEKTNRFLKNILDSSTSISIVSTDLDGNILFWNRGAEKIFGYRSEEMVNKNQVDILYPDDETREAVARIRSPILEHKKAMHCEIEERTKDGRILWLRLNLTPRVDETGRVVGILGIGEDITERRRLQKERENLEKQLQLAEKMEALGTLAGGLAHDFNNLLMTIQGNTTLMLQDSDPSHSNYPRLKNIEKCIQSGAGLTGRILGLVSGGKYKAIPTDLNVLVERSCEVFGRTQKDIRIHTKPQEDIWIVEVDRFEIEKALLNLYVNAWQAMPDGGDLFLQTKNVVLDEKKAIPFQLGPGKYVTISVKDTGTGIDEENIEKIFDPFFTTKEVGRGTGLGLSSTYGIIRDHKGMIEVSSRKGGGTTFKIYLPVSESKASQVKEEAKGTPKGTETILLVDDEEMIIDVGREMLERLGYTVFISRGGADAVELYKKNCDKIDLVILDVIMPDMNGRAAFEALKEINAGVKVLISTGSSLHAETREMLRQGAKAVISKPFDMKALAAKIRDTLVV